MVSVEDIVVKSIIQLIVLSGILVPSSGLYGQSVEEFDAISPECEHTATQRTSAKADTSKVARMVVEQTNALRRQHELPSLKRNQKLVETARYFVAFMARTEKYGHRADGQNPSERADEHGYEYCIVLENIGYAYGVTGFESEELADQFMSGWRNSAGHRENLLDPDVLETGVAVSESANERQYFVVQMFGRPLAQAIRFEISNASDQNINYSVKRTNS
jgi:uncharacterized protein YkwD